MRVRSLRTYDLPDVGDHVIHFTGRQGPKVNVEAKVEQLPAQERLIYILVENVVRGFCDLWLGSASRVFLREHNSGDPEADSGRPVRTLRRRVLEAARLR